MTTTTIETTAYRARPPSVRNYWTVEHQGVLVGAWPTRDAMMDWLTMDPAETILRVPREQLTIVNPTGESVPNPLAYGQQRCSVAGCKARFQHVPQRRWPELCLDHADERSRDVDGWTPANSVD